MKKIKKIAHDLEVALEDLELNSKDILSLAEKGIKFTTTALDKLRQEIVGNSFKGPTKEIFFFKKIKEY